MLNLASILEDTARRHPNRDAVVLGDTRLDYDTVNAKANAVANLLVSRGIGCGNFPLRRGADPQVHLVDLGG